MTMQRFTADEAKRRFGALLRAAGEGPVEITKNGRGAYYLMTRRDFAVCEDIRRWLVEEKVADELTAAAGELGPADAPDAPDRRRAVAARIVTRMPRMWSGDL